MALDIDKTSQLVVLIEKLTTTGERQLDANNLKALKKICRQSDGYVTRCYQLLWSQLEYPHAQVRYSAVQLADQLFQRSHAFRTLLIDDLQNFMVLTVGTIEDCPLPKPKSVAADLKKLTLETIQIWNNKFAEDYKKLGLGFNYLKECKKVDFQNISSETQAERERDTIRQRHLDAIKLERLNKATQEMQDTKLEMCNILVQLENCLSLLLPNPEDFELTGILSPHQDVGDNTDFHNASSLRLARDVMDVNTPTKSSDDNLPSVKASSHENFTAPNKDNAGSEQKDGHGHSSEPKSSESAASNHNDYSLHSGMQNGKSSSPRSSESSSRYESHHSSHSNDSDSSSKSEHSNYGSPADSTIETKSEFDKNSHNSSDKKTTDNSMSHAKSSTKSSNSTSDVGSSGSHSSKSADRSSSKSPRSSSAARSSSSSKHSSKVAHRSSSRSSNPPSSHNHSSDQSSSKSVNSSGDGSKKLHSSKSSHRSSSHSNKSSSSAKCSLRSGKSSGPSTKIDPLKSNHRSESSKSTSHKPSSKSSSEPSEKLDCSESSIKAPGPSQLLSTHDELFSESSHTSHVIPNQSSQLQSPTGAKSLPAAPGESLSTSSPNSSSIGRCVLELHNSPSSIESVATNSQANSCSSMNDDETIKFKIEPGLDFESQNSSGSQTTGDVVVKMEEASLIQNDVSLDAIKKECEGEPSNPGDCSGISEPVSVDVEMKSETLVAVKADNADVKSSDAEAEGAADAEFMEVSSEEEGFEEEEEEEEVAAMAASARAHGFTSQTLSVMIDLPPQRMEIEETPDNTDVLHTMMDLRKLLQAKYIPMIQKWLEVFAKSGGGSDVVKRALDLKQAFEGAVAKVTELRVKAMPKPKRQIPASVDDDDSDEDDFEEVADKEGYEPHVPDHLREEAGLAPRPTKPGTSRHWHILGDPSQRKIVENDPLSYAANLKVLQGGRSSPQPGTSNDTEPRKKAYRQQGVPVIPYGMDLMHWGQEHVETPTLLRLDSGHRFWTPINNEEVVDKSALEGMKSRAINFPGKFEPVKWKCRAPMANGKLCERMDRVKCPFHGKIFGRDNMGRPTDPGDQRREAAEQAKKKQTNYNWEDATLQAEIEAATGHEVVRKAKGRGKGKKVQYPGLIDINKPKNSTTKRLEKKVFNRGAMKRVSSALDSIAHKRIKDKFANQFNYQFSK